MEYYSKEEIEDCINKEEKISINDEIIQKMIDGEYDNYLIREGLCGRDVSNWDFSGLSNNMLKRISFDSDTIFPNKIQANAKNILENSKIISTEIEELNKKEITEKGVNIAIIDTPFDETQFSKDKLTYYQINNVQKENHGITVASIISQIVPESKITFFGDNKQLENRDLETEEFIASKFDGIDLVNKRHKAKTYNGNWNFEFNINR